MRFGVQESQLRGERSDPWPIYFCEPKILACEKSSPWQLSAATLSLRTASTLTYGKALARKAT